MKHITRTLVIAACLLPFAGTANAASITLNPGELITGTAPTGAAPWASLNFLDTGAGAVRLTLQSNLEAAAEFISDVVFNGAEAINPLAVRFTPNVALGFGTVATPTLTLGANGVSLSGVDGFDFGLKFTSSTSGGRFDGTDRLVYDLTCDALVDAGCNLFGASSFSNVNDGGRFLAAIRYQGIATGAGSGTFGATSTAEVAAVPEPASMVLLGTGLAAAFTKKLRRRRNQLA